MRDDNIVFDKPVMMDADLTEALDWCAARSPSKVQEEREKMMLSIENLAEKLISDGCNERWCVAYICSRCSVSCGGILAAWQVGRG